MTLDSFLNSIFGRSAAPAPAPAPQLRAVICEPVWAENFYMGVYLGLSRDPMVRKVLDDFMRTLPYHARPRVLIDHCEPWIDRETQMVLTWVPQPKQFRDGKVPHMGDWYPLMLGYLVGSRRVDPGFVHDRMQQCYQADNPSATGLHISTKEGTNLGVMTKTVFNDNIFPRGTGIGTGDFSLPKAVRAAL